MISTIVGNLEALENKILKEEIAGLDNFPIDSNSLEFSGLIQDIINLDIYNAAEINEDPFRAEVADTFSYRQKYVDSASTTYKASKVLQSTIVFFAFVSTIAYSVLKSAFLDLFWNLIH